MVCKNGQIDGMRQELLSFGNDEVDKKQEWQTKIAKYKNELKEFKREFENGKKQSIKARDNKNGNNSNNNSAANAIEHKIMENESKNTEMLEEITKTLHETENMAIETKANLDNDRKKIENIQNNVNQGSGLLTKMENIVRSMDRRAKMMKVLCIVHSFLFAY